MVTTDPILNLQTADDVSVVDDITARKWGYKPPHMNSPAKHAVCITVRISTTLFCFQQQFRIGVT